MELWSAFLIGFLGSFHCVAMCGPIALSLPISAKDKLLIWLEILIYNLGRIVTYAAIGLIVGIFGRYIFYSGYQQYVSIILGVIIILIVLLFQNVGSKLTEIIGISNFQNWLTKQFSKFINKSGVLSLFIIGILNGFLPCGLVYMAVVGAFTNYNLLSAIQYMIVFGLGTLPLMLLIPVVGRSIHYKLNFRRFIPIVALLIGALFILRGLNLGIPYVSPKILKSEIFDENVNCY